MIRTHRRMPFLFACSLSALLAAGCGSEAEREKKAFDESMRKAAVLADAQAMVEQKSRERERQRERMEDPVRKEFEEACYAAETASRKKTAEIEEQFDADRRKMEANSREEQRVIQGQIQDLIKARMDEDGAGQRKMYEPGMTEDDRRALRDALAASRRKYESDLAAKQEEGSALLAALRQHLNALMEEKAAAVHAVQSNMRDKVAALKDKRDAGFQAIEDQLFRK